MGESTEDILSYSGESSLHLAIVHENFKAVEYLVRNGANVNERAIGDFFLPEDIRTKEATAKSTNYTGFAYYGEYPLAFAACFAQEQIYDYLIQNGADPNLQDSLGNTVLHMCVIMNKPDMYKYCLRHHMKPAHSTENNNKLTPLTLASALGRYNIFKLIIEWEKVMLWKYSNIECSVYPIAALDTIAPNGATNWMSALMILLGGETNEHLDMLDGGMVRQLLDEKWETYIQRRFFFKFALAIFHLVLIMIAVYTRPSCGPIDLVVANSTTPPGPHHVPCNCDLLCWNSDDGFGMVVRWSVESLTLMLCLYELWFQAKEIRVQGVRSYLRNLLMAPAHFIYLIGCILLLGCIPFRVLHRRTEEMILLCFAIPSIWAYLLFFARGFKLTGPFVTMIYKMCQGDLVRFGIIYGTFLFCFGQSFYYLFKSVRGSEEVQFDDLWSTLMTLFQMTLGEFNVYDEFENSKFVWLTKVVFVAFLILMPILLLNMLIAMMGNTYQQVITRSTKEWRRQWAKLIVVLERGFSKSDLQKFQADYAIPMPGSSGENMQRGLMVVQKAPRTSAQERKRGISNWRRVGRWVLNLVKEHLRSGNREPFSLENHSLKRGKAKKGIKKSQSMMMMAAKQDDGWLKPNTGGLGLLSGAVNQLVWEKDITLSASTVDLRAIEEKVEEEVTQAAVPEQPTIVETKVVVESESSEDNIKQAEEEPNEAQAEQAEPIAIDIHQLIMNSKKAGMMESREPTLNDFNNLNEPHKDELEIEEIKKDNSMVDLSEFPEYLNVEGVGGDDEAIDMAGLEGDEKKEETEQESEIDNLFASPVSTEETSGVTEEPLTSRQIEGTVPEQQATYTVANEQKSTKKRRGTGRRRKHSLVEKHSPYSLNQAGSGARSKNGPQQKKK